MKYLTFVPPPPPNLTLLIAVLFLIRLLALQFSIVIPASNVIRKKSMVKKVPHFLYQITEGVNGNK
jgi:hypothetical protein